MKKALCPLWIVLIGGVAGCGGESGPRKITEKRPITVRPGDGKVGATSVERFGEMPGGGHGAGGPDGTEDEGGALEWDVPAGWGEEPPNSMRIANLRPAKSPEADCYVSIASGGVLENVNRWRKQFGQAPIDATELQKLPARKILDLEAVRVELGGAFTTMDGKKKEGFALVGYVADAGDRQVFIKMTGPQALVAAEQAGFETFVASLRLSDPKGGGGAARGGGSTGAEAGFQAAKLKYDAPSGWTKGPDKPQRIVTLRPAGSTQTECAVSSLNGDAGGVIGNVQRWRGQMGLPELSAAELGALAKLTVLGKEATVVDMVGHFEDSMNGRSIDNARFLGLIVPLDGAMLFVKLTGPEAEVAAAKDAFFAFCQSLRQ